MKQREANLTVEISIHLGYTFKSEEEGEKCPNTKKRKYPGLFLEIIHIIAAIIELIQMIR